MKEHGKEILFLLAIALLLFSPACSTPPPAPSRTAQEVIRLKQEPPTQGVDLFLVIDESGSMYGERGTDPQGLRYEASKYLLQNLLVKKADRRFPHRISLIHFDDRATTQPLTDLVLTNAADLARRVPHTGEGLGDTSFIEALRRVRAVDAGAPSYRNRRKKVVVLFYQVAKGGGRIRTNSTHQIFVHSFPYLEPLRPISLGCYSLSDGLGVELILKRDHASTDPEREFKEHPNNLILAQRNEETDLDADYRVISN